MQEQRTTWLQHLCSVPIVGDWAATVVGLAPILVLLLARHLIGVQGDAGAWFLLVGSISLIPWLIFLERWQRLRINIPYLPIKLLWVVPLLAIGAIAELLGLLAS